MLGQRVQEATVCSHYWICRSDNVIGPNQYCPERPLGAEEDLLFQASSTRLFSLTFITLVCLFLPVSWRWRCNMNLLKGLSKQILEKKGREPTCVFTLIRMEICISFHIHIPVLSTPVCILHLNICSLSGGLGEANPGGGDTPEQILQPVEEAAREGDPAGDFWQGKGNYQTKETCQ